MQQIVADNVRTRRLTARLGLRALAARVGISKSRLARIESGQVAPPIELSRKLSRALGCALQDLMLPGRRASEPAPMPHTPRKPRQEVA